MTGINGIGLHLQQTDQIGLPEFECTTAYVEAGLGQFLSTLCALLCFGRTLIFQCCDVQRFSQLMVAVFTLNLRLSQCGTCLCQSRCRLRLCGGC